MVYSDIFSNWIYHIYLMMTIICPKCNSHISAQAELCPECNSPKETWGGEILKGLSDKEIAQQLHRLVQCYQCGKLINRFASKCPHCRLDFEKVIQQKQISQNTSTAWWTVIITAIIITVIFFLAKDSCDSCKDSINKANTHLEEADQNARKALRMIDDWKRKNINNY